MSKGVTTGLTVKVWRRLSRQRGIVKTFSAVVKTERNQQVVEGSCEEVLGS